MPDMVQGVPSTWRRDYGFDEPWYPLLSERISDSWVDELEISISRWNSTRMYVYCTISTRSQLQLYQKGERYWKFQWPGTVSYHDLLATRINSVLACISVLPATSLFFVATSIAWKTFYYTADCSKKGQHSGEKDEAFVSRRRGVTCRDKCSSIWRQSNSSSAYNSRGNGETQRVTSRIPSWVTKVAC